MLRVNKMTPVSLNFYGGHWINNGKEKENVIELLDLLYIIHSHWRQ